MHKRVLTRFLIASTERKNLTGGERAEFLDAVWQMYAESYNKIGMHLSSSKELLEYDLWEVYVSQGKSVAFIINKSTSFGQKLGLLGSDGSSEGKGSLRENFKDNFSKKGYYGEVSHAVEKMASGFSVVCSRYVPKVLHKTITPLEDGVHYERKLDGVGMVTKKMVGSPNGVPSGPESSCTPPENPGQPLGPEDVKTAQEKLAQEQRQALVEHAACMYDFSEDSELSRCNSSV